MFQVDTYLCHGMKMSTEPQYIGKLVGLVDHVLCNMFQRLICFPFLLLDARYQHPTKLK